MCDHAEPPLPITTPTVACFQPVHAPGKMVHMFPWFQIWPTELVSTAAQSQSKLNKKK